MIRIAIFASGSGSNAEQIALYFKDNAKVKVEIILTNRKDAKVLERAKRLNISAKYFTRDELNNPRGVAKWLADFEIDLIVLAGFLWLIPHFLIRLFPNSIINIHPALLPKYGGKNMYGMKVHEAVIAAGEKESGITIHFVDEDYDHGTVIFQAKCQISDGDTPEILASKIHKLEYAHYARVIGKILPE